MPDHQQLVEHFFRHEYARLVASLTRIFGARHFGLIEDVVQSALLRALASWSLSGIPAEPQAWLCRVARNLAIDSLRRDLRWNSLDHLETLESPPELPITEDEINDDLLRMIFICCDEAAPPESQIALALKTLCGFDVKEIARALLTTDSNITRRITRAKDKLRGSGLDPANLTKAMMLGRLPNVLAVIYLLFNEGYSSTRSEELIREDLCDEAVRLAVLLAEHPWTRGPESSAFVALLLFHASRLDARLDDRGSLLLLANQDRSRWDATLIAVGFRWFGQAAQGDIVTRYHAEAWIAAEHCRARTFEATNWDRILRAYDLLIKLAPSPIHELNRAIAIAERDGPELGWVALQSIDTKRMPEHYYLWAATAGELCRRRGDTTGARRYFEQALADAPTKVEREFLRGRLQSMGES